MKKTILAILILLLAGPAMASTVAISITPYGNVDGDCNGWAKLSYTADANVRAFALKITATRDSVTGNAAKISDIKNYFTGESTSSSKGYGIFFGENGIDVNSSGGVDSYGNPVYDANLPGAAGTGIGTNTVILGMGSLYQDGNQPPRNGKLCDLRVNKTCKLSATAETTYSGGVVMEDGTSPTLTLTAATNVVIYTFPLSHPYYNTWGSYGKPKCWCYDRQCKGDTDNLQQGTPVKHWVLTSDLTTFLGAWKRADSLVTGNLKCADFDHIKAGTPVKFIVFTGDLTILLNNWKRGNLPNPDCFDSY